MLRQSRFAISKTPFRKRTGVFLSSARGGRATAAPRRIRLSACFLSASSVFDLQHHLRIILSGLCDGVVLIHIDSGNGLDGLDHFIIRGLRDLLAALSRSSRRLQLRLVGLA